MYIKNDDLLFFDTKKLYHEWYGEARLRTKKKARRWQNSLTGQNQLQLSVPSSHRGSIASLDDLHLYKRSRSMCSMQLDTVSLNLDLFSNNKASDDGVWAFAETKNVLSHKLQFKYKSLVVMKGTTFYRLSLYADF